MSEHVITYPDHREPTEFTRDVLPWLPWLEPLSAEELTDRHRAGLVDPARQKSPYFMLLARDPDILGARTRTDKDIFYNPTAGLPRAERELAAAATSRLNGCIYCASVHARFSAQFSKREADVDRLLDEGVGADLGARWNAVVAASVALTAMPLAFGAEQITALRETGLDDLAISDAIHGAAFFNWANRLMLSLGVPSATA
jgi:alkylhydroperoxidase domain protein